MAKFIVEVAERWEVITEYEIEAEDEDAAQERFWNLACKESAEFTVEGKEYDEVLRVSKIIDGEEVTAGNGQ